MSKQNVAPLFLKLQDVGKHYGDNIVLSGIGFEVREHEIVCLLGASGCGKTTTLLTIAGVLRPDAGRIWIGDKEVAGPQVFVPPEKRHVGFVFQDYALFPHLTAERNVAFGVRTPREHRRARAAMELERFGIKECAKFYPHQLSGGERQRVALARALASDPEILLLDEPFSSLDRQWRETLREETADMLRQRGAACVFVTHDPEEACILGDRIVLVEKGRILQQGTPTDLYENPVSVAAAGFFGRINLLSGTVSGGKVRFGKFIVPVSGLSDGEKVKIVIRPEAFMRDRKEGSLAVDGYVRRISSLGMNNQLSLAVDGIDEILTARPAMPVYVEPGGACRLYLNKDYILMFPEDEDEG